MSAPVSQLPLFAQRWRERREYRLPARGVIAPERYQVEVISEAPAKAFVVTHHYAGTFPAARLCVGLIEHGAGAGGPALVGVAVFAQPMNQRVVPKHLGCAADSGVELSRLVLLDRVPGNAESWFVARAFRRLTEEKPGIEGVVSYCDPLERRTTDGRLVLPGHVGTVYQALNASYQGRGSARTLLLTGDGRVISERALSKVRRQERGADYAERQIIAAGAPHRRHGEAPAQWVERILEAGCFRQTRHPGNHVYAFGLTRALRRQLRAAPAVYPKQHATAA